MWCAEPTDGYTMNGETHPQLRSTNRLHERSEGRPMASNSAREPHPPDERVMGALRSGRTAETWLAACVQWCRADGAAVVAESAADADVRLVTYATDDLAERLADLQYLLGCGPHTESMAGAGHSRLDVEDPDHGVRWTTLVDELATLGVVEVATFPIGTPATPLGTLQMYWRGRRRSSTHSDAAIAALVERRPELLAPRVPLCDDLDGDTVLTAVDGGPDHGFDLSTVHLAIGVVVARHHLGVQAASALLRAQAYSAGTTVTEQARQVLDDQRG